MSFVAVILISVFFGSLIYYIAGTKGYNKQFWLIMGILFGPFSLLFIILGKKNHMGNNHPSEKSETRPERFKFLKWLI